MKKQINGIIDKFTINKINVKKIEIKTLINKKSNLEFGKNLIIYVPKKIEIIIKVNVIDPTLNIRYEYSIMGKNIFIQVNDK
ncbi:MAG: hypothetical protein ACP6IY_10500 [Promethearchaeia archaeon]